MKWIGQHIYDNISRFRDDVYLEDLSTTTETDVLVVDSTGKVSKNTIEDFHHDTSSQASVDNSGSTYIQDVTLDTYGHVTGLTSAAIPTLNQDTTGEAGTVATIAGLAPNTATTQASQPNITTLAGVTSLGAAGATTNIVAGDVTMYNAVNDGNPTISLGSSAANRFEIKTVYNSGALTLDEVYFNSYTTSASTNDGRYIFQVDEVELCRFLDSGISVTGNVSSVDANATVTVLDTTTSSATQGGKLKLVSDDSAAMGDDHRLGVIEFQGAEDGSSTRSIGARIQAVARDAWDGSNNDADLEFYTTDGTTESKVLTLDADKLATFTGAVTATGALTGTLATASQPNITTVGTIGTGVWEGTAVATDQQKHVMHYQTTGYSVPDGTNYDIAKAMSTNTHPFLHDQSIGSDGLTAQTVQTWARNGGHVMPRACTLKRWTGWSTAVGSGTAYVALFKVTPARNDNSNVSAVLLEEFSYTAMGNAKMEDFDETSFTDSSLAAGDIVVTALKGVASATMYFNATYEVEF